jgi:hypothetical protein
VETETVLKPRPEPESEAGSDPATEPESEPESESEPQSEALAGSEPADCPGGSTPGGYDKRDNTSRSAGLRAHINVTVGLETLLGLNEDTADLAGHGPITAPLARALAFAEDSTWRRLITDPVTGYLLDYGRTTYRPPAALADHIRARDMTCRMPNCDRPATACDLDHLIAYPAGTTCEENLCAACRRDHRLKHEGQWQHHLSTDPTHPPGTTVIISPTGHVYLSHPYNYTTPDGHAAPELPAHPPTDIPRPKDPLGKPHQWVSAEAAASVSDDSEPPPF